MNDIERKILAVRLFRLRDEIGEVAAYLSPFGPRALLEVDRMHTKMSDCLQMIRSEADFKKEYDHGSDLIDLLEGAWLSMCENDFTEHTLEVIQEALDGTENFVETLLNDIFQKETGGFGAEWINAVDEVDLDQLGIEADRLLVERIDGMGLAAVRK